MSNPDPRFDYADYDWGTCFDCPFCGAKDQEGEDLGDSPVYLTFECCECNKSFSCDTMRGVFYDEKGSAIQLTKKGK